MIPVEGNFGELESSPPSAIPARPRGILGGHGIIIQVIIQGLTEGHQMSDRLTYSDEEKTVVRIGDVVMAPGGMRGIVIGINGGFVKVLGIGTSKETGDTFILPERFVHDFPASDCMYMKKQTLNW